MNMFNKFATAAAMFLSVSVSANSQFEQLPGGFLGTHWTDLTAYSIVSATGKAGGDEEDLVYAIVYIGQDHNVHFSFMRKTDKCDYNSEPAVSIVNGTTALNSTVDCEDENHVVSVVQSRKGTDFLINQFKTTGVVTVDGKVFSASDFTTQYNKLLKQIDILKNAI